MSDPKIGPLDLVEIATQAFQLMWDRDAAPYFAPDATFPKSPNRARDMYYSYFVTKHYYSQDKECTIIGVEQPFALVVSNHLPTYIGRMDAILENAGQLEIHEHKTSKFNSPVIFTGYEVSLQTEGYLTVGHVYYDNIPKIIYNQALCQKAKVDHTRHIVTKQRSAIDRFLSDYTFYAECIIDELNLWDEFQKKGDIHSRTAIPDCFHRNAGYPCTQYFRACEYMDLCQMRNNPLTYKEKLPEGYKIEEWDPTTHGLENDELLGQATGLEINKQEEPTHE
jgi:hypothetical protein